MGYFDESLDGELYAPPVSAAMKRQIGEFFVAWGRVELSLDVAFHVLYRMDPNLAACIYANFVARQLYKRLHVIHEQLKQFDDEQLWEATGIQTKVALPILLRRRKSRLPRKDDSQARRPKPEKSKPAA